MWECPLFSFCCVKTVPGKSLPSFLHVHSSSILIINIWTRGGAARLMTDIVLHGPRERRINLKQNTEAGITRMLKVVFFSSSGNYIDIVIQWCNV